MTEEIQWIDVSEELPDSGSEVLVCFERNDCIDRDVAIAGYDDSYEEGSHWQVDGGLGYFGTVLYWAEMPMGPPRSYLPPQVVATDALEEIREIWAGAEVGEPVHAQEAYAINLCKQMYQVAVDALAVNRILQPFKEDAISEDLES